MKNLLSLIVRFVDSRKFHIRFFGFLAFASPFIVLIRIFSLGIIDAMMIGVICFTFFGIPVMVLVLILYTLEDIRERLNDEYEDGMY
jgi:hypothetical protein